jgi:hypothetical protein
MPLRIYIAYGAAANQVTALRLQALAAVNGLTVYVPPAYTRQDDSEHLDPQSDLRLREAHVVSAESFFGLPLNPTIAIGC